MRRYHMSMAESALAGRGWIPSYPTNFIPPPGQAFFLYAAKRLWPTSDYQHLRTIQALVSMTTLLLAGGLALDLCGYWAAVFATWLLALLFRHADLVGTLVPETNYVFALLAFAWCLVKTLRGQRAHQALASGLLLGAVCLLKPTPTLFAFVAASLVWVAAPPPRRARNACLLLLGQTLIVAPWIGRNCLRYGGVYPISTNGGILLSLANFPGLDAAREDMRYWDDLYERPEWQDAEIEARFAGVRDDDGKLEDNLKDRAYTWKAVRYMLSRPGHFLRNYVIKIVNFLRYPEAEPSEAPVPFREVAWLTPLATVLGLSGAVWLVVVRRSDPGACALPALLAYLLAFGALLHITRDGRMNLPFRALLMVPAGCLMGSLVAKLKRPDGPAAARGTGPGR